MVIRKTQITVIINNKSELKKLYEEGEKAKKIKGNFSITEGLAPFCKGRYKSLPISEPSIKLRETCD